MNSGRKVFFVVGAFLVAMLATAFVANTHGFKGGYAAGLTQSRADNWSREASWRTALKEIELDTDGSPLSRVSVVFLDPQPQATSDNTPGDVVIGVFRGSGENRFTRYTIQRISVQVERYADEWGKRLVGRYVISY